MELYGGRTETSPGWVVWSCWSCVLACAVSVSTKKKLEQLLVGYELTTCCLSVRTQRLLFSSHSEKSRVRFRPNRETSFFSVRHEICASEDKPLATPCHLAMGSPGFMPCERCSAPQEYDPTGLTRDLCHTQWNTVVSTVCCVSRIQ